MLLKRAGKEEIATVVSVVGLVIALVMMLDSIAQLYETFTYRMAMDAYRKDPAAYRYDPRYLAELESVNHREYCTGYFFDDPMKNPQLVSRGGYLAEKAYLAYAVGYDEEKGEGIFVQRNKYKVGDAVELLTPGKVGEDFIATALFDENGAPIESTPHPYMTFRMPTPFPVKEGDILRMK